MRALVVCHYRHAHFRVRQKEDGFTVSTPGGKVTVKTDGSGQGVVTHFDFSPS
jgi:hypothetical protein